MIRQAAMDDLEQIVAIYNQAVEAKFQTGFTEPFIPGERAAWLLEHTGSDYPLFVHTEHNVIAGWVSISPYRKGRGAFRYTVEISYFIEKGHQGEGIGSLLVAHSLSTCRDLGYRSVIAVILDKNTASCKLAEKSGFERWGFLPGVADFNGIECNHLYYGLKL